MKHINAVNKSVLIISDIHAPYHFKDYLKFLKFIKDTYKPDIIINTGDEVDGHAISFHDSDCALPNADQELELAIEQMHQLYEVFPSMHICESNHGSLIYRRTKTQGIPLRHLVPLDVLYTTPGWFWHNDILIKTKRKLDTYICHGKTTAYNKLAKEMGCNAIQGHFHGKFEITWQRSNLTERYNMFIGCLIDYESLAFAYGRNHLPKPILGCAFIDNEGMPHLVKMNLNNKGRWDGKL